MLLKQSENRIDLTVEETFEKHEIWANVVISSNRFECVVKKPVQ